MTGEGIKEFFEAVEASREEFEKYVGFSPTPGNADASIGNICPNWNVPVRPGRNPYRMRRPIR